ncbi:hypothetical protein HDU93_006872 [Gonapodya sp. JEL0774]|nr:hypothetical protein HDU93_006872 [Gonapodya sp. JEL0774]
MEGQSMTTMSPISENGSAKVVLRKGTSTRDVTGVGPDGIKALAGSETGGRISSFINVGPPHTSKASPVSKSSDEKTHIPGMGLLKLVTEGDMGLERDSNRSQGNLESKSLNEILIGGSLFDEKHAR